jgi:RNA polymerase sigma-70 factor (ECF subfamily)
MFMANDHALLPSRPTAPQRRAGRPDRMSTPEGSQSPRDERDLQQVQLVAAMAAGDKAAMGTLYDQLSGPLYSLALQMLGNPTEAEDLTQDIFLQLWRTASSYRPDRGSVFSWAVTLTRNRAIDRLRMRKRRGELLAAATPDLQPSASGGESDSADQLWLREKAGAVRRALATLAPEQRTAIELAFFGGLTQQEIADRLQEPLGTVKARIRRGLLKLRDTLSTRL